MSVVLGRVGEDALTYEGRLPINRSLHLYTHLRPIRDSLNCRVVIRPSNTGWMRIRELVSTALRLGQPLAICPRLLLNRSIQGVTTEKKFFDAVRYSDSRLISLVFCLLAFFLLTFTSLV